MSTYEEKVERSSSESIINVHKEMLFLSTLKIQY